MRETSEMRIEDRITALTRTYLDRLDESVALMDAVPDQYAADGPFRWSADRLRELESDCDRTGRRST